MDNGIPKEVALQLCNEIAANYSPFGKHSASSVAERLKAIHRGYASLPMTSIEGVLRSIDGTRSSTPHN
jgi:hypothetical protein